ncbi:MAG: hypothetical protein IGQ45_13560 [Cyanobacterium sp. T60_A2020_053]|nr:hypothetical protein [Cyanobacterium sp. T60_A2020_053]
MLASNKPLDDENVVAQRKILTADEVNLMVVKNPPHTTRKVRQSKSKAIVDYNNSIPLPWWLKIYSILSHSSSWLTVIIVLIAGSIYGLTVYAPQQWTSKYNELEDLRRRERQFTLADEIFKNKLAQEAENPKSGLVNPENSQPPLFLPKTEVKPVELLPPETVMPKTVKPVFPIAY